ncbi:MAG: D-sedoheptulose-7-phosphate isomerase [Bacteriovoracaceae bacterium]
MTSVLENSLIESESLIKALKDNQEFLSSFDKALKAMIETQKTGNTIFSCGNGGSMADAIHFAEEMTGRFQDNRRPLSAIAISDPGYLSCVANDYGYEHVYSRFIEGVGKKGDVILGISTSGNSKNVILAAKKAKKLGITSVGLLGKDGGELKDLVDIPIIVSSKITHRIQEVHIKVIHSFIEGIEREITPENY